MIRPVELHPILVHFPIALLLTAVALLAITGYLGGVLVYDYSVGPASFAPALLAAFSRAAVHWSA